MTGRAHTAEASPRNVEGLMDRVGRQAGGQGPEGPDRPTTARGQRTGGERPDPTIERRATTATTA